MDSPTLEAKEENDGTFEEEEIGGTFEEEENDGTFEEEENDGTFEEEEIGGTFEEEENDGTFEVEEVGGTFEDSGHLLEILKTCEQLEESNDVEKLSRFLDALPPTVQMHVAMHEPVLRARALISYNTGNFTELYSILKSHKFSQQCHLKLQHMWWDAHYQEYEQIRERTLGAVDKYRVRRKYPCPPTIVDVEQTVHGFKEKARQCSDGITSRISTRTRPNRSNSRWRQA
uniref:Homeobox protein SIX1 N-terminal SD domain-containing protein n=1 Tax=Globodera rostochiensis TaxID=31243 RepID=A0A914GWH1_GLORO